MRLSEEMRANCPAPDDNECNCGWPEYASEVRKLEAVANAAKKLNIKLEGIEPERDIDYTASWGAFRDLYDALAELKPDA